MKNNIKAIFILGAIFLEGAAIGHFIVENKEIKKELERGRNAHSVQSMYLSSAKSVMKVHDELHGTNLIKDYNRSVCNEEFGSGKWYDPTNWPNHK